MDAPEKGGGDSAGVMANPALRQGFGPQAEGWCGQAIDDSATAATVAANQRDETRRQKMRDGSQRAAMGIEKPAMSGKAVTAPIEVPRKKKGADAPFPQKSEYWRAASSRRLQDGSLAACSMASSIKATGPPAAWMSASAMKCER